MKNIQVIDGALNCVYDIFQTTDDGFKLIFGEDADIAFGEDLNKRDDREQISAILDELWKNRVPKARAMGIHGVLFVELYHKKQYYPTLRDEEAINPGGAPLRGP